MWPRAGGSHAEGRRTGIEGAGIGNRPRGAGSPRPLLDTYRGRPVAVLLPLGETERWTLPSEEKREAAWKELVTLGQKIGQEWQSDMTGVEILSEIRR